MSKVCKLSCTAHIFKPPRAIHFLFGTDRVFEETSKTKRHITAAKNIRAIQSAIDRSGVVKRYQRRNIDESTFFFALLRERQSGVGYTIMKIWPRIFPKPLDKEDLCQAHHHFRGNPSNTIMCIGYLR